MAGPCITLLATTACRAHAYRLTDNDKTVIADRVAGVPVRQLCRGSVERASAPEAPAR